MEVWKRGADGSTISTTEGHACAWPCPPEESFDSLISTHSMTTEAPKTATLEIIFFRRNAYFRNELIHLEGSTSYLLVLASFQPLKAYHQPCHSNFAGLDK